MCAFPFGQPVEPDPGNAGEGAWSSSNRAASPGAVFLFPPERKVRHDVDASRAAGGDPSGDRPCGAIGACGNRERLRTSSPPGESSFPQQEAPEIRPVAVGEGLTIKVNANVGSSRDRADISLEMEKMRAAVAAGADAVMDLSTGGPIDEIRRAISPNAP